jgi:hypothetical protein
MTKAMTFWMMLVSAWMALASMAAGDEVGASWRRVDKGAADPLACVAWDGPLMVGVGARGLISTSTDAKTWTTRFQGVHADLKGVAWSGSHYVAVGNDGVMLRSANGIAWQRIDMPEDYEFSSITWTGSEFLALDSLFYLSTSADGISWNRRLVTWESSYGVCHFDGATYLLQRTGVSRSVDHLTWSTVLSVSNHIVPAVMRKLNGRLIYVGPSNAIRSSADGITWTMATLTGVTTPSQSLVDVAWSGSEYLAVGTSNFVWRSTDAQSWTMKHAIASGATYVKWIGGQFVAGNTARTVQTSPDGREWTKTWDRSGGNAMVWTGARYISVGQHGRIMTSEDFETWTTRDSGSFSTLWSVVWTGSFALAGGDGGTLLKSVDGLTWTPVGQGTFSGLVKLVSTGTQYYAFSSSGTHVSPDGNSWTPLTTAIASQVLGIRWLRGMFISVGVGGGIRTSPDGITWTPQVSGTTAMLESAGASDQEFLAGGQNGTLLASPDGVTWTPRTSPVSTVSALEHRFGKWFVAAHDGIYQSVDGIAWAKVPGVNRPPIFQDTVKLVWTGSELVCTGLDARTTDGATWQQVPPLSTVPAFNAVAKGPGGYVAVGASGVIWQSPDGYAWQPVASPATAALVAITASPGRWVAVGNSGTIVTSPDGIEWALRDSPTSNNLLDVAWNGQRFAAVGAGGTILSSADGSVWSASASGITYSIYNVEAMGSAFRAFANAGRVFESPDGIAWTLFDPQQLTDVVWNGTHYVAISRDNEGTWANVSSPDGLTWTRHPMGTSLFLTGLCWTGSLYVACGTSGTILTSPDAITWTPRNSGTNGWIQAVNWNGTQLVAVGEGCPFLSSPDGITWTAGTVPTGNFEDVAWADGRYVAVGDSNASATSTNGVDWQSMTGSMEWNMKTVERIGTVFLAGGSGLSSAASTGWVSAGSFDPLREFYDFETNGSMVFATSKKGIYKLEPAAAPGKWAPTLVHPSPWMDNMAHHGNEFLAVGVSGTIVLSRDGITWQTIAGGRDLSLTATAWSGSHFAGVGDKLLHASPDGRTWSRPASPLAAAAYTLNGVIWTGSRFIATGLGSVFESGADGATWTSLGTFSRNPYSVSGLAGDDDFLVAVGSDGLIAVSDGSGEAASDYQAWIAAQGADSDRAAPPQDANDDGINNLIAYALGIPAAGTATPGERAALPAVSFDGNDGGPVLTFILRESYRPGTTYIVEASSELEADDWLPLQQYTASWATGAGTASVSEASLPGGGVKVTVRGFPGLAGGKAFFRLRVVLP